MVENTVHTGVDGKRYLVIHGDIFDLVVQNARWLAHLGDKAYDFAIQMNRFVNFFRALFGVPYWSLSQWAKLKVKNAVNYIGAFEKTLAAEARRHGADGVICGHIHYATIRDEHGIRYMNCGDWVESCTALVEHEDGRFEIITWTDPLRRVAPCPARRRARRLMRILVATDAWHPQVNGVVRTLTMMAEAAKALRRRGRVFSLPQSFRTFAMPSYRDLRLALPRPAKIARLIDEAAPGQHSYRHRRADRTVGAALLPQTRLAVHHELPHPLSGIRLGARAGARNPGSGRRCAGFTARARR